MNEVEVIAESRERTTEAERARSAGRGVVSISSAKLYFIVTGYAVQLLLPRLLGSPEAFGLFSSAMNVVSILNNVLITATVQTVSKRVSEDVARAELSLRHALIVQLVLGAVLAGSLGLSAPILAERVLLDPLLTPLIRVSSIVVFCYALYPALIGSINGRQRFGQQAGLDVTYTSLRTLGMLGAAALGYGAFGALSGFAGATVAILAIALAVTGIGQNGGALEWRRWLSFMAPLWLYQLCLNLTLQVDLSVLKASVAALQIDAGVDPSTAADAASRFAGFYRAAQTFAFVPYQLILSVSFVIFPLIAQAVSAGDLEASRRYIRTAMRLSLLVLLAIAAPVSGAAAGVMRIAYPSAYLAGSGALAILALGMVCFSLFTIGGTILSSAGRPGVAAAIALATVALVVGCDLVAIRVIGVGVRALAATAAGTTFGMAAALLAVAVAVRARFSTFIAWSSFARAVFAAGVAWSIARVVPSHSALTALVALVAGGVSYVVALIASRELTATDFAVLRRLLKR